MIDLIFDANSIWARAFYASHKQEKLTELEGAFERPKNAVELGVKMVLNVLNPMNERIGKKADRMLFCWDGKAKREKKRPIEKPAIYDIELQEFKKDLGILFGAAHASPPEHEADDAVATAVYRSDPSNEIYVVSGDKDLQQLQSTNVHYYCLNEGMVLSRQAILERWNVKRPSQICIALAVLGDSGDNIPGIHGWGPKKVEKLFEKVYPEMDLEHVLEVVEAQIPHDKLLEFRESLELTILDPNVPDVPDPLPLNFASMEDAQGLGLAGVMGRFSQVKRMYSGATTTESLERFIDDYV